MPPFTLGLEVPESEEPVPGVPSGQLAAAAERLREEREAGGAAAAAEVRLPRDRGRGGL